MIIGSAMDIIRHCRVPRYLHNDLPLGNPLGEPGDRQTQRQSVELALQMIETSTAESVLVTDASWSGDPDWRDVYNRVSEENREALLAMGEQNRAQRAANNSNGLRR